MIFYGLKTNGDYAEIKRINFAEDKTVIGSYCIREKSKEICNADCEHCEWTECPIEQE